MACLTENQIVEFFSPERPNEISAGVDAHAASCERCRRLLAEYAHLAASTSATHHDEERGPGLAALPSLAPTTDNSRHDRVELVQRLVQAQARKYVGAVVKGKWEIEELIGTGGMAHVFAARHRNGRRVAIKCMRPELMFERSLVERFLREGYVANKIEHPGAVAILDDDVMEDGTPFLVMELLVGRTLRERLDNGPLAIHDALRALAQVLDLLAAAHDKGIVHRDLKPDNLFETEGGTIKVLDFGIARLKERARPDLETRSGLTMGTVGYMPPEQARGLTTQVDARSDVWATGATLFSLITGRRIHEASTTNEALLLAMTSAVPLMSTLLPSLPPNVQSLLDTSLAFDKERRFSSARAMKEALDAAMLGVKDTVVLQSKPPLAPTLPQETPPPLITHAAAAMTESDPPKATTLPLGAPPPDRRISSASLRSSSSTLDRVFARHAADTPARAKMRSGVARLFGWGLVGSVGVAVAAIVIVTRRTPEPPLRVAAEPASSSSSSILPSPLPVDSAIPRSAKDDDAGVAAAAAASESASASTPVGNVKTTAVAPSSTTSSTKPLGTPTHTPNKTKAPPTTRTSPSHAPATRPTTEPAPVDTRDPLGPQH